MSRSVRSVRTVESIDNSLDVCIELILTRGRHSRPIFALKYEKTWSSINLTVVKMPSLVRPRPGARRRNVK